MSLYKATSMYDPTDADFNRYDEERSIGRAERQRFDEAVDRAVEALRKNDEDIWGDHLYIARKQLQDEQATGARTMERLVATEQRLAILSGAVVEALALIDRSFFNIQAAQTLRRGLEDSK